MGPCQILVLVSPVGAQVVVCYSSGIGDGALGDRVGRHLGINSRPLGFEVSIAIVETWIAV